MIDLSYQAPPILGNIHPAIKQAVTVQTLEPGGVEAVLAASERKDGGWYSAGQPAAAVIGRGGFVPPTEKSEGDGCTPTGAYPLGLVFGYAAAARTAMPYRQITADDYWVDDPTSPQYNTWVRGRPQAASWENMLRPDGLYRWGIVIEYNTAPVIPGKGSAIFVHIWRGPGEPTIGCVALAECDLLRLIAWLEPEKNPVIVLSKV